MKCRTVGKSGLNVSPVGFGAFKIGRNEKVKYSDQYDLPNERESARLLNGLLDLGISFIDTAPAYGLSEERIGRAISQRRDEFVLSTKVGETFTNGTSTYGFSSDAVRESVNRSLQRLKTDVLDLLFIHSDGSDLQILKETDVVETLIELKAAGTTKAIGFSGKTVDGARAAIGWADAIMVEYHSDDTSHAEVIADAARRGVGVVVKKGLASGRLSADNAIRFVLSNPHISSLVIGGLNLDHLRANVEAA